MIDLSVISLDAVTLVFSKEICGGEWPCVGMNACLSEDLVELGRIIQNKLEFGIVHINLLLHCRQTAQRLSGNYLIAVSREDGVNAGNTIPPSIPFQVSNDQLEV